ncbi:ATP-binding protein [Kitasatospora sp. NPDC058218]|uniref:ATP-binding protein n=1 Tax=Kitasatospora sp. NPDC058218 TaxID=3346385 RepID=UPI0036DF72A7
MEPRTGTAGSGAPPGQVNAVAGGRVDGSVVQAGAIHGGVHLYPAAAAAVALPVPRQLPPVPRRLVGREADLAALDRSLGDAPQPADVTLVVTGPAGVGKTALAAQWLRGLAGRFPDGQLYADLRGHAPGGPADPAEALGAFLRAFGIAPVPGDLAEGAALWRSLAAERRIAVLLDNASTSAQVRPLLPGSEHALVVVTSRRRLTGLGIDGAVFRPLGLLPDEASARLLSQRVGEERVARERAAAAEVVERCAGLPLAVCLAAARIAARPVQALAVTAEALGHEADRLAALDVEGETVRNVLDASFEVLEEDAARLYRLLGLLPFPVFTPDVVRVVGGVPAGEAARLLDGLIDVHLLEEVSGGFRFHDLVKLHARACAETVRLAPEGLAAAGRVLDWYLACATAAEALVTPTHRTLRRDYGSGRPVGAREFGDEAEALGWLDGETTRLAAALHWAAETGRPTLVWQLADAMWPLFLRLRPAQLWVEAHRLGLVAARTTGDRDGELRMLTSGGNGLRNAGEDAEAADWFAEALELARTAADRLGQADALYGLSQTHRTAGRLGEAADCLHEAVRLREAEGYPRGAALARLALGDVLLASGRAARAVEVITAAHHELTEVRAPYEAARALAFLGQAHTVLGAYGRAERCYAQALAQFRSGRARRWEARVLELGGELARVDGRAGEAAERFGASLALYRELGAPDAARVADRIGALERGAGLTPRPGGSPVASGPPPSGPAAGGAPDRGGAAHRSGATGRDAPPPERPAAGAAGAAEG